MTKVNRKYPAKLLLFGEHTVLKGSSSLAIPIAHYFMQWVPKEQIHPDWLSDYVSYLSLHCSSFLDMSLLSHWIEGRTIQANIPIGYGLGSSGALTAAIYDVCTNVGVEDDLKELQKRMGIMESFFHGKSSGFDPLVSYCNAPILKCMGGVQQLHPSSIKSKIHCYILDSGKPRVGSSMIQAFLENYKKYPDEMNQLSALNDQIINQFLEGRDVIEDLELIRQISSLQLEYMSYMIPEDVKRIWQKGLSQDLYYLKICGAGGGGFFILFSKNEMSITLDFKLEKIALTPSP